MKGRPTLPTPATWLWAWDNDLRENADLAASLGLMIKRHHTTADAGLFISATDDVFAFPGATPARDWGDLWAVYARIVNRVGRNARMISQAAIGTAEPNGDDDRLVKTFGVFTRIVWPNIALEGNAAFNGYGPYDYHRDFNFTYPVQLMGDISFTLGRPQWFSLPQTRFGVRAIYRTLDHNSNRYAPPGQGDLLDGERHPAGLEHGEEWEFRTYVHLSM